MNKKFIISIFISIILAIIICILLLHTDPNNQWANALEQILISAFAALIISAIVDIPNLISKVNESVFSAMTSNAHLKDLTKEKLIHTKIGIDEILHKASFIPSNYFDYINEFEKLAFEPYYDSFSERIICSKEDNVYKKNVEIKYTLVNPTDECQSNDISLRKYLEFPSDMDINSIFKISSFEVSIDGMNSYDIKDLLLIRSGDKKCSPNSATYGKKLYVSLQHRYKDYLTAQNIKNAKKVKQSGAQYESLVDAQSEAMIVQYSKKVTVNVKYEQCFPDSDCTDTRILRYLTRRFDYSYYCDDNVKLHGHLISSKINNDLINLSQNSPKDFSVSYSGWMLPGSGAFLVIDDIISK